MTRRRVVVTGLGMLTPLGADVNSTWEGIKAGRSGIRPIEHFDTSDFSTKFAGLVPDFELGDYLSAKEGRKMDLFVQYGMVAAIQAIGDAGLDMDKEDGERIGAAIGSGIGGLTNIEENHRKLLDSGPRKLSPFFVPSTIINMIAGNLAIMYGFKGPNFATVSACTTGTHNIGFAAQQIQLGVADVMIAGGAEKGSTPLGMGGFAAARALSSRNDEPQAASRPWDRERDGFVLGDGAGAVVLEEYERAKARGATIYAELVGYGMSDDAYHMTAPSENGAGAALSMRNALRDAGMDAGEVDYINAHATSTKLGDLAELNAVKQVFGEHADKLAVSSTKSMIGHLLGAAGAVEAIMCLLAMRDNVAPPTINLNDPDDGCDLNLVPNQAQDRRIDVALSNSFGFGGTNGTLLFRRV
ncbi:beta-ketoacyl-ACP synthase II [Alloalcanivorax xenomutans]|uniref:3-oxoacyl-[acyl-carrier-protein] synthase 2 n=1 Tax=Alloalcanivorax xenomutans TaxID=1094342 RepID=A0A9Q3W532_9GAMM|nr:beta-ketoacyl-ACP synthase II [Alloalcanivorax xenomutans]KYZ86375.1 beta-ketoacyl-[acyl-carrier-protein] synthase II [Alcanivorax sp. KX64203]MBA4721324.1 beta-ketoacyl-ACP synthase II [Alcanivorax sp.]ARB46236.1 3-oxoacyl-ACP synthase [Alloalcanivorax xenomutans]MCE7507972.1 beta-ketoacyl-ACP synthase II [Alloalcanivorax xenomutans]WOA29890.1 beta-ketoacyl-ACP synthase II [Alloalcanivorax xenomutans]